MPLDAVYNLPDMPGTVTAGIGELALFDRAPHPNAAKVFANWIASKEGLTVFAKARGEAQTRTDVDEASFLSREIIPHPGVEYFDTYEWEFTVTKKEEIRLRMKELVRQR
jgi:iron(III) transport system substrate-binding protein